jgi:hypothetical protein
MLMKKAIASKEEIVRAGELMAVLSDSEPVGLSASKLRVLPLCGQLNDGASLTHFL